MLQGFKQFLLRGNVIDLAVAVVIGAALGPAVPAPVKPLPTPLIAAVVQVPESTGISCTINGSKFLLRHFVNALVSFLLIPLALYLFVVMPVNALVARANRGSAPPDP